MAPTVPLGEQGRLRVGSPGAPDHRLEREGALFKEDPARTVTVALAVVSDAATASLVPFHARFVLFEGSSVGFLAAPLGSNEDLSALGGVVVRDPECPGHDGGRPRQDQDPIEPASHDSFLEDQIQEVLPLPRRQLSEPTCGTAWRGSPPYQPLAFGPGKDPARRVDSGFALRLHALLTRP